jgi:protein-tyrosine phosphatase
MNVDVMLKGAPNFRDVGQLPTSWGGSIRPGVLFRSGGLAELVPADHAILDGLALKAIIDLRSASERNSAPTAWLHEHVMLHVSQKPDMRDQLAEVMAPAVEDRDDIWRDRFDAFYRRLPVIYEDEYRQMFAALQAPGPPVLIHCSAGKDRTGAGIALILKAVGVSLDHIIDDYMETGRRISVSEGVNVMVSAGLQHDKDILSARGRAILMGTQVSAIKAMFSEIDNRFGSLRAYLKRLGVGEAELCRLRNVLTHEGNARVTPGA